MTDPAQASGPAVTSTLIAGPEQDPTRQWARERAHRLRQQLGVDLAAVDVPSYGSPGWLKLAENDPRRWLALLAAAEAWRQDSDPHTIAVRLDADTESHQRADRDDWAAVRTWMTSVGKRPNVDDLAARRATHTGRSVVDVDGWPQVVRPGHWDGFSRCVP